MNLINRGASGLTLALALTVSAGCSGNTALVGRDTLPSRASQPVQDELVATVERVDTASREIHLRPNKGRPEMVTYSAETRVMNRGREYPVSQLERGDIVAIQLGKDSRGNPHTHLIRVQESTRDWAQGRNY
jgi:hypothetical protein